MTARELAAADAFFARTAAEPSLDAELERRLAGAVTPLISALAAWDEAPPEAATLLAVNEANVARFGSQIEETGAWPGLRLVGAAGADAAWMLAQHADRANDQRRTWLPLLAAAVESGDADPRQLATLTDRSAALAGEQQVYGTIVLLADDGEIEYPLPVVDAARLEERRRSIGLPPSAADAPVPGRGRPDPVRAGSRIRAGQPVADGGRGSRVGGGGPGGRRAPRSSDLGHAAG